MQPAPHAACAVGGGVSSVAVDGLLDLLKEIFMAVSKMQVLQGAARILGRVMWLRPALPRHEIPDVLWTRCDNEPTWQSFASTGRVCLRHLHGTQNQLKQLK